MQYALIDLWQLVQYQEAFDDDRERLVQIVPAIDRILQRRYGMVDFQDGVAFLKRGTESNPTALSAWLSYRQEIAPLLQEEDQA